MPYIGGEGRSADRSYRRTTGKAQQERQHTQHLTGIKAMIASGQLDNVMVIPSKALESMVFNTYFDEKDFGRKKYVVKPYSGSSKEFWNVLVAVAEGDVTIGKLREKLGDQNTGSSLSQMLEQNLVEFDKGAVQTTFGVSDEEVELRTGPRVRHYSSHHRGC